MESATDSEETQSPNSLSFPLEPPDIRNWFPSYQYDSFVLDTYDDAFRSRGQKDRSDAADVAEKIRANDDGNLSERLVIGEFGGGSEGQTFSEAPESLYSPGLLNEPNHPENWVSSYVSDSGGWDPDAELEAPAISESQGNEGAAFIKEGISREPNSEDSEKKSDEALEKSPSPDEFIANEFRFREGNEDTPLTMAPESSYSPAFLNEPDHPENWLSSYVSDSGGLDPDCEFETAAAICESQGNEGSFIKEGINRKETLQKLHSPDDFVANESRFREANEGSPLTKDPLSQSFLSEPPDIRNWFSSYAYESPALDAESNQIVESESQRTEDAIINREQNEDDIEMKSQSIDMDEGDIDGEFKLDALLHYDSSSRSHNQSHHLDSDTSIPKQMENLEGYKKSPPELAPTEDSHPFEEIKAAASDQINPKLIAESDHGSNISNHEAKTAASSSSASGFVTTRKKNRLTRLNHDDENSYPGSSYIAPTKCFKSERRKSCSSSSSSHGNAAKDDDSSSGNRKPLSERSPNVVVQQLSEVTGKWKCPQRSKPVMGPPLKQLRLEKWVTRL